VIGPTPPPFHGVSVATRHLLIALRAHGALAGHVETRDPRPVHTIGKLDAENLRLGLVHSYRLARLLRQERDADVYVPISQGRWGFLRDALLIGLAAHREIYVQLHGGAFDRFYRESGPLMRWLIRCILRAVHEAWVLTPSLRGVFDDLLPASRIRVIENVVDDPVSTLPARVPADRSKSLRILFLGNLRPGKGHVELLDALELLGDRARGWSVRFVGEFDPELRPELDRRARLLARCGVIVEFLGSRDGTEKGAQLRWSNVFVYPSHYRPEGQPLVLLEAMAAGLPVVSTRHAGIPDTVRHGHDGLLVEVGDLDAIARAMLRLADDPELRAFLGDNGRKRYEGRYRVERLRRDIAAVVGDSPNRRQADQERHPYAHP
jgi:glycosyltransferase involved in cell wall biosynthesis